MCTPLLDGRLRAGSTKVERERTWPDRDQFDAHIERLCKTLVECAGTLAWASDDREYLRIQLDDEGRLSEIRASSPSASR